MRTRVAQQRGTVRGVDASRRRGVGVSMGMSIRYMLGVTTGGTAAQLL